MKILVCVSGASFCEIGLDLLKFLASSPHEIYAVLTQGARYVLRAESGIDADEALKSAEFRSVKFYPDTDLAAPPASGSFGIDATIFAPCSIGSLAKIYGGLCDSLSTRAAAVALKEHKRLILGVREMPFSAISLRQMSELAALGIIIAPPVIAKYCRPASAEDLQRFVIGKWADLLGVQNELYQRWKI